jgi:hypothetical protein
LVEKVNAHFSDDAVHVVIVGSELMKQFVKALLDDVDESFAGSEGFNQFEAIRILD